MEQFSPKTEIQDTTFSGVRDVSVFCDEAHFTDKHIKAVLAAATRENINPAQLKWQFHCRPDLSGNPWELYAIGPITRKDD